MRCRSTPLADQLDAALDGRAVVLPDELVALVALAERIREAARHLQPDPSHLTRAPNPRADPDRLPAGGPEPEPATRPSRTPRPGQEQRPVPGSLALCAAQREGTGVTAPARPAVLIVDDDARVRDALRCLLDDSGMAVVGEAGDGRAGVELAGRLAPDVVVMDVRTPVLGGIEATRQLAATLPATRVIVCTAFGEAGVRERAAHAGAAATVDKCGHPSTLIAAIEAACAPAGCDGWICPAEAQASSSHAEMARVD